MVEKKNIGLVLAYPACKAGERARARQLAWLLERSPQWAQYVRFRWLWPVATCVNGPCTRVRFWEIRSLSHTLSPTPILHVKYIFLALKYVPENLVVQKIGMWKLLHWCEESNRQTFCLYFPKSCVGRCSKLKYTIEDSVVQLIFSSKGTANCSYRIYQIIHVINIRKISNEFWNEYPCLDVDISAWNSELETTNPKSRVLMVTESWHGKISCFCAEFS
jgi:hypothetical protein